MYPGDTDRDEDYKAHHEQNTSYLIDSLNPLSWFRAIRTIRQLSPHIVIFPWWTIYWGPCFWFLSRALRHADREIVFFCHNAREHEAAGWKNWLTRLVLSNADRFVVHTNEDRSTLQGFFPGVQVSVHPHPVYDHFPAAKGTLQRRKSLELLFYGFIRPYKGVDLLLDAMEIVRGSDIQLTIAGECWSGESELRDRIKNANLQDQIELRLQYHSDQETAELFQRADIVVLPYRSATGSGVVPIAYHYLKPVIVTRVGGLPDVVDDSQTGWIIDSGNTEQLVNIITSVQPEMLQQMRNNIASYKKRLSWDSLANTTLGY